MKLQIFSVYDSKVSAYLQPFFMRTRGEAIRAFSETCADSKHVFSKHSEDYTLFYLGTYDDSEGTFTSSVTPEPIIKAIELIDTSDLKYPSLASAHP